MKVLKYHHFVYDTQTVFLLLISYMPTGFNYSEVNSMFVCTRWI